VAVFGRELTYDTSEDATVRVAAGEVRKRLAQYYVEEEPKTVRIQLPPGSYTPEFIPLRHAPGEAAAKPAAVPIAAPKPKHWKGLAWAGALLVAAVAVFSALRMVASGSFNEFWQPMLQSRQPVVIALTHPVVYLLSERVHDEYVARHKIDQLAGPYVLKVDPRQLQPDDLIASTDQYIGSGDAVAAGRLVALFTERKKAVQLRIGQDLSFSDLRSSPAVLIGAYSNRWAMKANADYRFSFRHFSVVDRAAPGRVWQIRDMTPDYKSTEDYAIVSRVFHSYTGQMLIAAAGITNAGTQGAAEFITNPGYLDAALSKLPSGWQKRNLQLLLHCKVINNTPGPAEVVATHLW